MEEISLDSQEKINKCLSCEKEECTNCLASKSNQTKNTRSHERWGPSEIEVLKDTELSATECAKILNKSLASVMAKRRNMNIKAKRKSSQWTDEMKIIVANNSKIKAARILGLPISKVQRQYYNLKYRGLLDKYIQKEV